MARSRLSKAGSRNISLAAKRKWRAYRAAKKRGDKRAMRRIAGYALLLALITATAYAADTEVQPLLLDRSEEPVRVCAAEPAPEGSTPTATCCCSTGRGGICCAEMAYCGGGFVMGCACQ